MMPKVVIIRTKTGGFRYASFICKEINFQGIQTGVTTRPEVFDFLREHHWGPAETLIHARTASPQTVFKVLKRLENEGYRVINKADVVKVTSDKFFTSQLARKKGIVSPRAWQLTKKKAATLIKEKTLELGKAVVKPVTSQEEGKYSFLFDKNNLDEVAAKMALIPRRKFFIQEFVDYQRLYRVIVIGFKALREAVFYDEPRENWKASVCLNPDLFHEKNPSDELLSLGEKVAKTFEAEICFIDFFQTKKSWVLNEINTACSLIIHERKSGFNISGKIAEYLISQLA